MLIRSVPNKKFPVRVRDIYADMFLSKAKSSCSLFSIQF